jgi:hypothetical protein
LNRKCPIGWFVRLQKQRCHSQSNRSDWPARPRRK